MNSASLDLGGWTFTNWGSNDGISISGTSAADTVTGTSQSDYLQAGHRQGHDLSLALATTRSMWAR